MVNNMIEWYRADEETPDVEDAYLVTWARLKDDGSVEGSRRYIEIVSWEGGEWVVYGDRPIKDRPYKIIAWADVNPLED